MVRDLYRAGRRSLTLISVGVSVIMNIMVNGLAVGVLKTGVYRLRPVTWGRKEPSCINNTDGWRLLADGVARGWWAWLVMKVVANCLLA